MLQVILALFRTRILRIKYIKNRTEKQCKTYLLILSKTIFIKLNYNQLKKLKFLSSFDEN